ncbi:hypothetical protein [Liquorilactobacillus hordei]|uniref:hypothetical protein n=1 Tax=Liquorilactobacillus hordei TaxID=468911 RepID=UPI00070BF19B|nr:hypothetical protein [Liquorilactobacillus hordei]QYH51107.1 DNA primase [Liquorilactobacillus hordei DSM 19519]
MRAKELKMYLYNNKDKLITILEAAGFHDIWENNANEIRCATPNGTNKTSVAIKLNESLYTTIYSSDFSGDIIGAIQVVMDDSLKDTIMFIHACLGLSMKYVKNKHDPLKLLKKYSNGSRLSKNTHENKLYSKRYLNRFVKGLHKQIIEEGITPSVARKFEICYDPEQSRIIFPHYDWEKSNQIVGIKGRTTMDADLAAELDVPKYWNYISDYKKTNNLYGYSLSKEGIEKNNMIILFEAEKSVLKQFTFEKEIGYSVALGGHVISEEQVRFLLKNTPIDCEIVLAFDKDIMVNETEGETFIKKECNKFLGMRRISYIYDSFNILKDKSSPIDEGYKKWNYLLKWRKNYNKHIDRKVV